jgi:hypothetical protein
MAKRTMAFANKTQSENENIKLFFGAIEDYLNHAQTIKGRRGQNPTSLEFDSSRKLSQKHKEMRELLFEVVQDVSGATYNNHLNVETFARMTQVREAMFAVLDVVIGMVLPDALLQDIGAYTDARFSSHGDSFNFKLRSNALYTVSRVGKDRRHVEAQREYVQNITLVPEFRAVTVQSQWYKILTGEENISDFVLKAADSIVYQMSIDAYTALNTAVASLETTGDRTLQINGWADDDALDLLEKVSTWNNSEAAICGTKTALGKVIPDVNTIQGANMEVQIDSAYVSVGFIPQYKGYRLIEMKQKADYRTPYQVILDNDKLYILSTGSDKVIKMAVENGVITNADGTWDNADLTQDSTVRAAWDTACITNSIAGLINLV